MQLNLVVSQYKAETDDQEGFKKHLMSGVGGNESFVLRYLVLLDWLKQFYQLLYNRTDMLPILIGY